MVTEPPCHLLPFFFFFLVAELRGIYGEEGRNILIPAGSRLIGTIGGESDDQQSDRRNL